jgi:zinc protease
MGFRFYPIQPGEIYPLRILQYLLAEGETSRLRSRLLKKDMTARYLGVSVDVRLSVAALKLFCLNTNEVMVERAQKAILSEIDKLRTNTVSLDEINRAKRRFKTDYLEKLSTNLGKALFLVEAALAGDGLGDPGAELDKYLGVGPLSVQSFVSKYFIPQNRVVLELRHR